MYDHCVYKNIMIYFYFTINGQWKNSKLQGNVNSDDIDYYNFVITMEIESRA